MSGEVVPPIPDDILNEAEVQFIADNPSSRREQQLTASHEALRARVEMLGRARDPMSEFGDACRVIVREGYTPVQTDAYLRLRAWLDENGWPPKDWQPALLGVPSTPEKCPTCNGLGRVQIERHDYAVSLNPRWKPCPDCVPAESDHDSSHPKE